jgi:amino acid transporter
MSRMSTRDIAGSQLYAPNMSDATEPEAAHQKKRQFPTVGGVFAGILVLVMGIIAHFSNPQPFWAAVNAVVIVLSIAFALANLIGLFVLRKRQQS